MHTEDTIAAISTPLGQGGIGIVRLSGGNSAAIVDKIFRSSKKKRIGKTRSQRILYGEIVHPVSKEVIDEVLVSVMRAPHTYTREDVIEINCHGGGVPVRMVLELVLHTGARLAEPGEFTQRAFLNGRIDLSQAEAVLDVINSRTVQSQKSAVEQLRGGLSRRIHAIREQLIELTAFVEAYTDFPEEDIEAPSLKDMKKRSIKIQKHLNDLIESSRYGIILREGLKTAIIGRPNVGKSSLLNALLEHDRAIVTEMPGTTRDVIEEYLNIQGLPIRIIDTAGIRHVQDIAEKEGVKRSLSAMEGADLVLLILDGSSALHETDIELLCKSDPDTTIPVINKIDLPFRLKTELPFTGSPNAKIMEKKWPDLHSRAVRISAREKRGLSELKNSIVQAALKGSTVPDTYTVTNVRHVHALEKALAAMHNFTSGIANKTSPEFLSLELREALDAVGEILGITTSEDILNHIFENFCIGK